MSFIVRSFVAVFVGMTFALSAAPAAPQIQGNQGLLTCMKPFIPYIYIPLSTPSASEDDPHETSITVAYNGTDVLTEKSSLLLSIDAVINGFESPTLISAESPALTYPLIAEHLLCPGSLGISLVRLYGFESVPTGSYKLKVNLSGNKFSAEFLITNLKVSNSITLTGNGADQSASAPSVLSGEAPASPTAGSSATVGAKGCALSAVDFHFSFHIALAAFALFSLAIGFALRLRHQWIR